MHVVACISERARYTRVCLADFLPSHSLIQCSQGIFYQ
jgi:hypothetical protein